MRVVGVIDIRSGRAVHARAGDRSRYVPVSAAMGVTVDGDALALARTYVDALGVGELYVADLDAIEYGARAMQFDLIAAIAGIGAPVWVDAGTSTLTQARHVLAVGASVIVVGLETLERFDDLAEICAGAGKAQVAFSLDVRGGVPVALPNVAHATASPPDLAVRAQLAGARSVIVLDLARVGTAAGFDRDLLASVRRAAPGAALFAGGGVRDSSDLAALGELGCDGALVATALLTGAIKV